MDSTLPKAYASRGSFSGIMVLPKAGKTIRPAASCTECQRRKQKCSRQWPCNHCQARKIPHLCQYPSKKGSNGLKASAGAPRKLSSDEEVDEIEAVKAEQAGIKATDLPALAAKDELRNLGYLPSEQNLLFGNAAPPAARSTSIQATDPVIMPQEVQNVLRLLPPKPYTDILVQQYLQVTNFSYYCLYPPTFSHDYASWWSDRVNSKPLTPEFTCLLIRVCACSAQYLTTEIQQKFESELGESVQSLSEAYHHAAKQLSNTIPPGKGGLAQVQQLFLTAAWFKSESFFVESWHALSTCIHEAQELGMHKSSPRSGLSEFDLEIRRRIWCLLYSWDWQMSLLLSRPLIINTTRYPFELPNMQLECLEIESGPPSPVAHIAAQCELGQIVSRMHSTVEDSIDTANANPLKSDIEKWLTSLPLAYQETDPDTQWDIEHIYVPLQRQQLHAIGYMTMLLPYKPFLSKTFDSRSPKTERDHRATAVKVALHLMEVSRRLFDQVFPINAKFHLVTFLVFDTAAFLCSAMIHDKDGSIPQRENIVQAVSLACSLMCQLAQVTKTGAICFPVLVRLAKSLSRLSNRAASVPNIDEETSIPGAEYLGTSFGTDSLSFTDSISPDLIPFLDSVDPKEMFLPNSLDFSMPDTATPPIMGVGDLLNLDVGQFDQIWDWQNLDLTLFPSFSA